MTGEEISALYSSQAIDSELQTWHTNDGGNGHRYGTVNGSYTWEEANEKAAAIGGHLVTITSAEEWTFITSNFSADSLRTKLIGATDEGTEGTWR